MRTWKLQHENDTVLEVAAGDLKKLKLLAQSGYRWAHLGDASGWLQIHLAMSKVGVP